jgi:hypothetical protein
MNKNLLNEQVSPFDSRDYLVEAIVHPEQEYPETLDYRPDLPPAWDQGKDGPCSAFTVAAMKMWQEKKDIGLTEDLSPYFVYNFRKNRPQSGMYPRDTMQILKHKGIPRKKLYKKSWLSEGDIPEKVLKEAQNHRISGYAKVTTVEGLKKSLFKHGPAYISMPVYNGSMNFWYKRRGEEMLGGHAILVVGYNKGGFILRNSWGTKWGDKGHTVYPYSHFGSHWEIWTAIDDTSEHLLPVSKSYKGSIWSKIKSYIKNR